MFAPRGKRYGWLILLLAACQTTLCGSSFPSAPVQWRTLEEGLRYGTFVQNGTTFHALRVDLARHRLEVADARPGRAVADVAALVLERGALAGVNGTFFDEKQRPLGWLVSAGTVLNPIKDTDWFAALVVRDKGASVLPTEALKGIAGTSPELAVQVGPRTVVDGQPLKLKKQSADRTAVCVVGPRDVILLVTAGQPVEANWLAQWMARPESSGGLGCQSGLMFDGGPSTQLAVRTKALNVDVPGGWPVPNAVVVVPRE